MVHNLSDHKSVVGNILYELRSEAIQKDSMRFRFNMERLGEILAYEMSKHLNFEYSIVETPMGEASMYTVNSKIVLTSILRAGLTLHNGFLRIFDKAENAFVSAYRQHDKDGNFEINLEYVTCPALNAKTLIIIDPMLATGASIHKTLEELSEYGNPAQIHVAAAISSIQGVRHIKRFFPHVSIWTAAIDEELTAKSYIVPGLGDAGDLAYGSKMQD